MTHFHMRLPHHDDLVTLVVVTLVLAVLTLIVLSSLYIPNGQLPTGEPLKLTPMPTGPW